MTTSSAGARAGREILDIAQCRDRSGIYVVVVLAAHPPDFPCQHKPRPSMAGALLDSRALIQALRQVSVGLPLGRCGRQPPTVPGKPAGVINSILDAERSHVACIPGGEGGIQAVANLLVLQPLARQEGRF